MINKTSDEEKLLADPDYIRSTRHNHSLLHFTKTNPNGVSERVIGVLLGLSVQQVQEIYQKIILKIRQKLKIVV